MENKLVKVLLQNKRKNYIDTTKMRFYIDNNETQMFLDRKYFFVNNNGDFNLIINPEWTYNTYLKDKTKSVISGKELIKKLQEFLKK